MKRPAVLKPQMVASVILALFLVICSASFAAGFIIDHNCTDISKIPEQYINIVKTMVLHHTGQSHGRQVPHGMINLETEDSTYDSAVNMSEGSGDGGIPAGTGLKITRGQRTQYSSWNCTPGPGEYHEGSAGRLWTTRTLDWHDGEGNVIDASLHTWCWHMKTASEGDVTAYLASMEILEAAYPDITFVYMTDTCDSTGDTGYNRWLRHEQIRTYCENNDKVLFDFADMESWSADGTTQNTYLYNTYNVPTWHSDWTGGDYYADGHINEAACTMKAKAMWWLMARLAGWNPGGGGNQHPVADAGLDQTVNEGTTVTLDGSNSYDPDGTIVSYYWTQTAGTSVDLSDPTDPKPTFTAPSIVVGGEALTFELEVTDNGNLKDTDSVIINVSNVNQAPIADAGDDQTVNEGTTVNLDGTNSYDPDGTIVSYYWTQETGVTVTLSDPTDPHSSFVTPPVDYQGTTLTFQVTVQDNGGLEDTDLVSVTINDNGITGFPADVIIMISSTGESIGIKEGSGGDLVYLEAIDPSTISDTTNRPENLVYGLIEMKIKSNTIGGTVKVTFYLPMPAPDEYKWYKYSPKRGWYDYNNHADFNNNRDQVTLTLIDGGIGDDDGIEDGVIVDPSGFGTAPSSTQVSSVGSSSGGCFIATAAYGSTMDKHVKILTKFRDKRLVTNPIGHSIVDAYYKFSPPVADYLRNHPLARAIVRYVLVPVTSIAYISLYIHPLALLFTFILLLLIGVYCFERLTIRSQRSAM